MLAHLVPALRTESKSGLLDLHNQDPIYLPRHSTHHLSLHSLVALRLFELLKYPRISVTHCSFVWTIIPSVPTSSTILTLLSSNFFILYVLA